jgi:uncharacterized protein (UPF0210 family)
LITSLWAEAGYSLLLSAAMPSKINLGGRFLDHTINGIPEPQGIAYSPETNKLFVASGRGKVYVYDGKSYDQITTVDFVGGADNLRYDAGTKRVYVGCGDDEKTGAIAMIDATTNQRLQDEYKLGGEPESFQRKKTGPNIYANVPDLNEVVVREPDDTRDCSLALVRAITAFITIDPKSYPSQIEVTVKFLSQMRDAVKAAGYDVAGIRISTQPFPEYTRGLSHDEALKVVRGIDDLAGELHFSPNVGPAMVKDTDDSAPAELITEVLAAPGNRLNANIVTAGDDGIHWNAVRRAALIIKTVGARSRHGQGNFNFAAIAMVQPYGPFYQGAWDPGGPRSFAIGLEAANVVMDVFSREHDPRSAGKALTEALSVHMRAVEAVATKAASGSTYAGIDPTPAPSGAVSIGAAIESFTGAAAGSPGTETAAGLITRAVKDVPVKQKGYSGLMIPVLEDSVLTRRWTEGTYGLDSILAYSAVCAGGVDTVPLADDTSEEAIARIVGDVATLAFKMEQSPGCAVTTHTRQAGRRDDRVQWGSGRDHSTADRLATPIIVRPGLLILSSLTSRFSILSARRSANETSAPITNQHDFSRRASAAG